MAEQDQEKAKKAIRGLLEALDIARVVYVDDANTEGISVEDLIAAAENLDTGVLLDEFPELGSPIPDDPGVLSTKIRQVWDDMEQNARSARAQAVVVAARRLDGKEADDVADVSILAELIPEGKLISLSPSQWNEQRDQLLEQSEVQRTLFLFDRDFSPEGGDSEAGIKIIASLLSSDATEKLICGLLTHTVTPETQLEHWQNLSTEYGIPKDRFVVIPKLQLSQAPILFAQTLKFSALSPDFAELKEKTKAVIADATSAAAERVDAVNIYDLDHIVFQVSLSDGLWEPDMLFRLHAMFHRKESRRLAHDGGALEEIAARLRAVSEIPTTSELYPTPLSAWVLQREELYESQDYINRNHLPLELGDVFARVGVDGPKRYILLAQPCDLMIRADGKRHPDLHRVPVAEIVPSNPITPTAHYTEEMPYFDMSPTRKWLVKLKAVHLVPIWILDMCVFNQDGIARMIVGAPAPSGIRPPWGKRHKILSRLLSRKVKKLDITSYAQNDSQAMRSLKQRIADEVDVRGLLLDDQLFKATVTQADHGRSVVYNCKRIERLSRSRAMGLLMSYTATLGRPAYDRDFGAA